MPRFAVLLARVLAPLLAAACANAAAQGSYDVLVGASEGRLTAGFHAHGGVPPAGGFATDQATGYKLYPADFGDFGGGPQATDDPGFQGFAGALPPGQILYARGVGNLLRWQPGSTWSPPPAGETVRLYGGVPTDVALAQIYCSAGDPLFCDPALAAQYPFYAAGTAFSAGGVSGPNPTIIDEADPSGAFHAHLDWFFEAPGAPLPAAYLLTLQLTTNGGAYLDSDPFILVFNHGLPADQFRQAVLSRTQPPSPPPPPPPLESPLVAPSDLRIVY